MSTAMPKVALLLLVARPLGIASHQRPLQEPPVAGISSKLPVRSSSFSSPATPHPARGDTSDPGTQQKASTDYLPSSKATDHFHVPTTSSTSPKSLDIISTTGATSSADAESSSENMSPGSASPMFFLDPTSTHAKAAGGDPGMTSSPTHTHSSGVQQELVETLEADEQVTVLGDVWLGELLCDSLVAAEGAPFLQLALSANETILAEQTSYVEIGGEMFTGGVGRRIWAGTVVDPEPAAHEAIPREVSMTWGEVCDVETFSLEITKRLLDGSTSLVKSVPCGLPGMGICLVEVALDFRPDSESLVAGTIGTGGSRNEHLRLSSRISAEAAPGAGRTRERPPYIPGFFGSFPAPAPLDPLPPVVPFRRPPPTAPGDHLDSNPQSASVEIDIAVFYSSQALDLMGVGAVQMESMISAAFLFVDIGFKNSEIALETTVVYQGMLPYEEGISGSENKLEVMRGNPEVNRIRDEYGADVAVLVGDLRDVCGIAYLLPNKLTGEHEGKEHEFGYACVSPTCFSNRVFAHELGHILGCEHNREDSTIDLEYAHGYRYCSGTMYTTIMSYNEGCGAVRANYFANPNVTHFGRPTGTNTENCARAIEAKKEMVSHFREPRAVREDP